MYSNQPTGTTMAPKTNHLILADILSDTDSDTDSDDSSVIVIPEPDVVSLSSNEGEVVSLSSNEVELVSLNNVEQAGTSVPQNRKMS